MSLLVGLLALFILLRLLQQGDDEAQDDDSQYSVGIEIEIIAEPWELIDDLATKHFAYYRALATALNTLHLQAAADPLIYRYRKYPEHYDKWWITKDGSLQISSANQDRLVPVEAVSPIFDLKGIDDDWPRQVKMFWGAFDRVFYKAETSGWCGSHFHVARGRDITFTLDELKTIAYGIVVHEDAIVEMLAPARRGSRYCVRNTTASTDLRYYYLRHGRAFFANALEETDSRDELRTMMQQDKRNVLWNFQNTLEGKSGTIEFRGGPGLRDRYQTAAWTAFTISLVHWFLAENCISRPDSYTSYSAAQLYYEVRLKADELKIRRHMPSRYTQLNGTEEWEHDC